MRHYHSSRSQWHINSVQRWPHVVSSPEVAKNVKLGELIQHLDLISKIDSYELRAEFISNVDIDQNGNDFIEATSPTIIFNGKQNLTKTYISDKRESIIHKAVKFDVSGFTVTEYTVDLATKATIAPIKATELVKMEGIADQSLFEYNVRGPLGKTGVNKEIAASINDASLHKLFPLFHNGITIICESLNAAPETLTASGYFVVNGCQSLTALFNNSHKLTEDLRILTKFIQMDPASENAAMVTRFSNNQNGVSDRDFMANNAIQIRLQNEFRETYRNQYSLEIKRGEVAAHGAVISNEDAGLFLMAFDLKEPWATHRKYQVFESKYPEIFGRPEVTADRIVMCQVIKEAIDAVEPEIENTLLARYRLTRYLLLYIIREILGNSETGTKALNDPKTFVRNPVDRKHFTVCIEAMLKDIVIDLNQEVKEFGDDFDYRGRLRDADWVRKMTKTLVTDHLKQVSRKRVPSFDQEWEGHPAKKSAKN